MPPRPEQQAAPSTEDTTRAPLAERHVYVQTFGCQMNVYDTERIFEALRPLGYTPTSDAARAHLILLNTCSVRERAAQKMLSQLGRFAPLKEHNDDLLLGVAGCVAQQEGERLLAQVPYLDLVFGPDALPRLPELVERARLERVRVAETTVTPRREYRFVEARPEGEAKVSEYVTVMKGCDKVCSYCVVPRTRGREVSKPVDDVVREVERFVARGAREVMLLGQNVNSFGRGLEGEPSFARLLRRVDGIAGLERLRFTTSYPADCTDELVSCFGELRTLCEYFHLPVQSGSERILAAMGRPQPIADYLRLVERLRARHDDMALATDIIVGYPGETEGDHAATLALVEEVRFDGLFGFAYSPRPGTRSMRLDDDVPTEVKRRRLGEVFELQREITSQRMQRYAGREVEVLVEGTSRATGRAQTGEWQLTGRTRSNAIVNFPVAPADTWSGRWIGRVAQVKVDAVRPHSLYGTLT